MKTLMIAVLLFSCSVYAGEVTEKEVWIFYDGNAYLKLIEGDNGRVETLYIAGLNDALSVYGDQKWMLRCFKNKTKSQLAAIFKKWLDKNPEKWNWTASILYVEAIHEACIGPANILRESP